MIDTKKKLHIIAFGDGNWDYYVTDDGKMVLYIAKPDSGAGSGIYCAASRLRYHFRHLQNVKHGSNWTCYLPDDWKVVDADFFKRLGIL